MVALRRRLANSALHPTSRRRHDLRVEHDIVNPGVEGFAFVEGGDPLPQCYQAARKSHANARW